MTTRYRPQLRHGIALAAAALLFGSLTACADTEKEKADPSDNSMFEVGLVGEEATGDPVKGGRLNVAAFGEVRSQDPVDVISSGLSGGSELVAVYDILLRYDPETGEYSGQLAEGIEANEDGTAYTLKLRDGVKFSDGTPLDADAVVASVQRYLDRDGREAELWKQKVAGMKAIDETTVEFTMKMPWLDFEYMLAIAPGMIVSSTSDAGDKFTPIGAGPFTFVHYKPGEELLLKANPNYWGGAPNLDELRFSVIQTSKGTLEVLQAGDSDVSVLREPDVIADAVKDDLGGSMNMLNMGVGLVINTRENSVMQDVNLRRAVAAALNPQTVIDRTYAGVGIPGTMMFPDLSQWGPTDGPEIDIDEARKLVDEAKENGFDGTIRYLGIAKVSLNTGLSIEAMLGQIGIQVEPTYVPGAAELVEKVFVKRDFDLAGWSFGTPDAAVFPELFRSFHSTSPHNSGGYASEEMDKLIVELGGSQSEEEQKEIIKKIQAEWNNTVPAIVFGAQPQFIAWDDNVGGVVPHVDSMVLYHDAWVKK